MSKLRKETIEQFINADGYNIAKTQGITAAANASGLSRPTVYEILQKYPQQPKRTIPQYIKDFDNTEGAKLFLAKNRNRIKTWKKTYRIGLVSWLYLGRKDPVSWTVDDYRRLWNYDKFTDSVTKRIRDTVAFSLRLWMRTFGKTQLVQMEDFKTRGLKRPKSRKTWFLEDGNMTALIKATKRHDLLLTEEIGVKSGGRVSSILGIRPLDCNFEKNIILMFEPKIQDYRPRFLDQGCMARVKRYIEDYQIAPDKPLFPSYSTIRKSLKTVAKEANIPQLASMKGATHIFKHTFVTQGAFHNLSMESISQQTGTNPNTLQGFYVGVKEQKLRHELLGEKMDILPFHEWVKTFEDLWNQQYSNIPVQKKNKKEPMQSKPSVTEGKINWIAIKKLAENPSTPAPLRRYWTERLKAETNA